MTGPARSIAPSQPSEHQLVILQKINLLINELGQTLPPAALPPGLTLTAAECNQIEEVTGIGTTRSAADLLKAIERLATIAVGDIRIPFTPGQLAELSHRAMKRGHTVEQEMKQAVARIEDELFYRAPGSGAAGGV